MPSPFTISTATRLSQANPYLLRRRPTPPLKVRPAIPVSDTTPPGAPANLRLKHSELPGGFIARYKPRKPNSINEVQTSTGDPNNEADWSQKGIIKGGRAEIMGFPPGTVVWVRVRTLGIKNIKGVWSDPAQIRIL